MICEGNSTKSVGVRAEAAVTDARKNGVERVAELVEQGLHLLQRQQRRGSPEGREKLQTFTTIGRTDLPSSTHVERKRRGPGARTFARAGVVIDIEHRQVRAIGILHFERFGFRMVNRQVLSSR